MTIVHETITLERHYDATPERVFRAFADPEAKALWFPGGPEHWSVQGERTFDTVHERPAPSGSGSFRSRVDDPREDHPRVQR